MVPQTTPSQAPEAANSKSESNLAPSAIFVKEKVLNKYYPKLQANGLVTEANTIIDAEGNENDVRCIEFKIACRKIAQEEIDKIPADYPDPEEQRKTRNAWNNFTSGMVSNVKPKAPKAVA